MPRRCTVCQHADRTLIESALIGGESYREISKRYRLSTAAVHRHREGHLPKRLTQARKLDELAHASILLKRLAALERRAKTLTAAAEAAGELRTALAGIREQARLLELAARIHEHESLSPNEARQFAAGVTAAVTRHVTDPATLRRIAAEFYQLTEKSTKGLLNGPAGSRAASSSGAGRA